MKVIDVSKMTKAEAWQLVFSYQEEIGDFTAWKENTPQYVKDLFDKLLKGC